MAHDQALEPQGSTDDTPEATPGEEAPGEETLDELIEEQNAEAQQFAIDFLKKVIRLRGVRIDRASFLRQELHKLGMDDETIGRAVDTTPVQAGVSLAQLDAVATGSILLETRKSAAVSFATGLPGGFALLATVPTDITQYYVHAFRVMQKLAYVYGWKDFLGDLEEVDDETLAKLAIFLGVMMGVGGAAGSLVAFAQQIARPALQKQIAKQALTKTTWYPVVKQTLRLIGIKLTKDSFAKTVTKAVPIAGGIASGGMTLVSLKIQSDRLHSHLRELPPPGVDAAQYMEELRALDEESGEPGRLEIARTAIGDGVGRAASGAKDVAGGLASGAAGVASGAAARAKGATGALLRQGGLLRRRNGGNTADDASD